MGKFIHAPRGMSTAEEAPERARTIVRRRPGEDGLERSAGGRFGGPGGPSPGLVPLAHPLPQPHGRERVRRIVVGSNSRALRRRRAPTGSLWLATSPVPGPFRGKSLGRHFYASRAHRTGKADGHAGPAPENPPATLAHPAQDRPPDAQKTVPLPELDLGEGPVRAREHQGEGHEAAEPRKRSILRISIRSFPTAPCPAPGAPGCGRGGRSPRGPGRRARPPGSAGRRPSGPAAPRCRRGSAGG